MGARSKNLTQEQVARTHGWRSGLEARVGAQIERKGNHVKFEELVIRYTQPLKKRRYTPDFVLDNGIIIETKGRFVRADRQKHLMIKGQHPDLDIRFVFSNPNAKLQKGAKSNYGQWCEKNGFKFAKEKIPDEWFDEKHS